MVHNMRLHPGPFSMIASGQKTIELRLYDEKRSLIQPDDRIIFTNSDNPNMKIQTAVKKLHRFATFEELYQTLPLEQCGYLPQELSAASAQDMLAYYSASEQQKYGVVGIEIELI